MVPGEEGVIILKSIKLCMCLSGGLEISRQAAKGGSTFGTDKDDGTEGQDDESQRNQQPHQVAVEDDPPITVKMAFVVSVEDDGSNPPEEKAAEKHSNQSEMLCSGPHQRNKASWTTTQDVN